MPGIFFARPIIYIEITDNMLTLATLRYTRKAYHLKNVQTHPLTMLEVINGVLFNPSTIFSILQQLLTTMTFKTSGCKAILALPGLKKAQNTPEHCIAFQAALCAAKTGLAVEQVISTSLCSTTEHSQQISLKKIPNLLQPFQVQNRLSYSLGITGSLVMLAGASFYCFEQTKTTLTQTQTLTAQIDNLKTQAISIQQLKKTREQTQYRTEQLQTATKNIQSFFDQHTSYAWLLKAISGHIPNQVILTTLELGRRKQSLEQKSHQQQNRKRDSHKKSTTQGLSTPLILKGCSYDVGQIISFNKALSSLKQLKNVRLITLRKLKSKKQGLKTPFRYSFTMQAIIRT